MQMKSLTLIIDMKSIIVLSYIFWVSLAAVTSKNVPPKHLIEILKDVDSAQNEDNETLQLVSVMFRHGNRTINPEEQYPKDPYSNYSYFPLGYSQLTNAGKIRAYSVGTALRKRYNKFLGQHYYPGIVEAFSTNLDRTKMSLQLALAGLFPPSKEDALATGLPWQPIPYNVNSHLDRILAGFRCPKYAEFYKKYIALPKIQNKLKTLKKTFDYISANTGKNITTIADVYRIYLGLSTEEEYGLTLPAWTASIWPETINKIAVSEYSITMGFPEMRRMAIGYFLEKLLKDINAKIKDTNNISRKIHVYAAHENTIAQLLLALGVFEKQIPTYGAYVIVELHKVKDVWGVKIYQESWDGRGLRLSKMPSCKDFCPLDVFASMIKDNLPTPGLC